MVSMSDDVLSAVEDCAKEAGALALLYFDTSAPVSRKEDGSPVTEADIKVSEYITSRISTIYPAKMLSEEGTQADARSGAWWIIDPIDGTANFIQSNKYFAVSIALVIDGIPQLAVVFAPALNTLYSAKKARGAYKNGKTILISESNQSHQSSILLDIGTHMNTIAIHANIRSLLLAKEMAVRSEGCASLGLCEVAEGLYDGFIHRGLKVWDIAAGILIAEEAGVHIKNIRGQHKNIFEPGIIAATPICIDQLITVTTQSLDAIEITA